MSKQKHKFFRSVLSKNTETINVGTLKVDVTHVLWCTVEKETSRSIYISHIAVSSYIKGRFSGVSARFHQKHLRLDKKTLSYDQIQPMVEESTNKSLRHYISSFRELTGIVKWFDRNEGEGWIVDDLTGSMFPVYACSLKGAKTCYPTTACVYLNQGDRVVFDLYDMDDHLSAVKIQGNVQFDSNKWNSLDHSKLAFIKDENGNFVSGLFG